MHWSIEMDRVLLLSIVFLVSLLSADAKTHYVLAEDGRDDCPTGNECHLLSYYTSHSGSYFANNAVFYFLKGTHYMNESVIIQGMSNISINGTGMSLSVIKCTNIDCGFFFWLCNSIIIADVSIFQISQSQKSPVVSLNETEKIYLLQSLFNVQADALSIINSIELHISHTTFIIGDYSIHGVLLWYDKLLSKTLNVNLYDRVSVSLINCTMYGSAGNKRRFNSGLYIHIANGFLYNLQVILTEINIIKFSTNIYLNLSPSLYIIEIVKFKSSHGNNGIKVNISDLTLEKTANVTLNSYPLAISNCELFNNENGLFIAFVNNKQIPKQTILMHSCAIHNNKNSGILITKIPSISSLHIHFQNVIIFNNVHNRIINHKWITFNNVSIYGTTSTGLTLDGSNIFIDDGITKIVNNTGADGGGIALYGGSQVILRSSDSQLIISNNKARYRGGGIFKQPSSIDTFCPIISLSNTFSLLQVNDNSAVIGDDIFGFNAFKSCKYNHIKFNSNIKQNTYPIKMCFCDEVLYTNSCILQLPQHQIYPGQTIEFSVAFYGLDFYQNSIITDGIIQINIPGEIPIMNAALITNCTKFSLQMKKQNHIITNGVIYINSITSQFPRLSIPFEYLSCPLGFVLSPSGICDCHPLFRLHDGICDIKSLRISHGDRYWIGENDIIGNNNSSDNCFVNHHCLYCIEKRVTFTLNKNEYHQCDYNRSGILCGQCRDNYSLLLGSNRCGLCNDNYNLALIILFAALGIILVAFLLLFDLTVSQGTLNGIIFCANTIKSYQPILSREGAYPFFNQALSWFNLDFGIEICFFDGVDNYSKTWLQYAFPLYLLIILGVLMVVSKRSSRVARLNLIPILSTILLLSYTKIVHAVTSGLNPQRLELHCENKSQAVRFKWYVDPNLPYAQGKHAYLFGFSLIILLFFCIPYTLFLLFSPVLEKYCQNYRCCHFLFKFKPIFDAYNGQVKDNYRFWTGLLLVARFTNWLHLPDIKVSLMLMLIVLTLLFLLNIGLKGVYESRVLNIFELWFLLMLIIITIVALFLKNEYSSVNKVWFTVSIAIFICSFLIILSYHVHLKLIKKTWYQVKIEKISFYFTKKKQIIPKSRKLKDVPISNHQPFTHSSFEINRYNSTLTLFDPPSDESYKVTLKNN